MDLGYSHMVRHKGLAVAMDLGYSHMLRHKGLAVAMDLGYSYNYGKSIAKIL
jgi:hypothetical protein